MSGYKGQESHLEHYLWQELESSSFLSLQEVVGFGPGALFWAKSGDLEEIVIHSHDGLFTGIKYEKILKPRFESGKMIPGTVCSTRLAIDGYNNGGYAPGTVKPYAYIGALSEDVIADPHSLYVRLVDLNRESYREKLEWLDDIAKRSNMTDDPGFEAFYEDAALRYQRLAELSPGNERVDS